MRGMTNNGPALPRRRLGQTDLWVTSLSVGCAPLGNMPDVFGYSVPEDIALATVRAVFASPVNHVDTAAAYGDGESERRIGIVLRERGGLPRGYVLQTKVGRDPRSGAFDGVSVEQRIERSLRLLGLDHLQFVFLHDPEHTSFEQAMGPGGPMETLLRYKAQGIIQHVGVAGGPIDMLIRYLETGEFEAVITHNRYTLLNRSAEPLIELAAQRGIPVFNAAPYASGLLAKGPDSAGRYAYQEAPPAVVARVREVTAICREYNVPLAAAALQFSLRDPRITSTVVGMSRPERVHQTVELALHPIPNEIWPRLDALSPYTANSEAFY